MKTLLIAALPPVGYFALGQAGAAAGLRFLSGQAVTSSELSWALAYLGVYAAFVLITPVLVLSATLEPLIRALLRAHRAER